jgi:hypothetical protein
MGHDRREEREVVRAWEALGRRANWPSEGWRGRFYTAAACAARNVLGAAEAWGGWRFEEVRGWNERAWPVRPIRVGLAVSGSEADALVEAPGCADVEFYRVGGGRDAEEALDRFVLDAVVCADGAGGLAVTTPEREGCDAGWYDWSGPRPISFASVFPLRFDCGVLRLGPDWSGMGSRGEVVGSGAEEVCLSRSLVDGAAVLSRVEPRIGWRDRLMGRTLAQGHGSGGAEFGRYVVRRDAVEMALGRVAECFLRAERAGMPTGVQRTAARVASAFAASGRCTLSPAERRRIVESAERVAGDEVEVMLRLSAVLLACYADETAMECLRRADAALRARMRDGLEAGVSAGVAGADPSAFVQAEMEASGGDALALGRLAAGLCLICAPLPVDKIEYLRDDTLDDMRFCSWAVGRDQDRQLIAEVFATLIRARREEGGTGREAA